jgi:hypothetical protein
MGDIHAYQVFPAMFALAGLSGAFVPVFTEEDSNSGRQVYSPRDTRRRHQHYHGRMLEHRTGRDHRG